MPEQRRYKQTSENAERIKRANEVLNTYIEPGPEFNIEGRDLIIIDLLTDLHHLTEEYEFDLDNLWRIAKNHYQTESRYGHLAESTTTTRPTGQTRIALVEITRERKHKGLLHWYRDEEAVIAAAIECPRRRPGCAIPDTFGVAVEVLTNLWYGCLTVQSERDIPKVDEYLGRYSISATTAALLDELHVEFPVSED